MQRLTLQLTYKLVHVSKKMMSAALKVYAKMATSADKGAVRDLSQLD